MKGNTMQLIFDIETIPSQHPDAKAQARASIKPPGTLKKPESIAAWWESEADAACAGLVYLSDGVPGIARRRVGAACPQAPAPPVWRGSGSAWRRWPWHRSPDCDHCWPARPSAG